MSLDEKKFLEKQAARHTKPVLKKKRKLKIPPGGLSNKEVIKYYKLVKEPAGGWRINLRRTINGLHIKMIGPSTMNAQNEIRDILQMRQMHTISKDPYDFIIHPMERGGSIVFEVDVEAERIYKHKVS